MGIVVVDVVTTMVVGVVVLLLMRHGGQRDTTTTTTVMSIYSSMQYISCLTLGTVVSSLTNFFILFYFICWCVGFFIER